MNELKFQIKFSFHHISSFYLHLDVISPYPESPKKYFLGGLATLCMSPIIVRDYLNILPFYHFLDYPEDFKFLMIIPYVIPLTLPHTVRLITEIGKARHKGKRHGISFRFVVTVRVWGVESNILLLSYKGIIKDKMKKYQIIWWHLYI